MSHVVLLTAHDRAVLSLAFSPGSQILASGSEDGLIFLWDLATRLQLVQLLGHNLAVINFLFPPDGLVLAFGFDEKMLPINDPDPHKPGAV